MNSSCIGLYSLSDKQRDEFYKMASSFFKNSKIITAEDIRSNKDYCDAVVLDICGEGIDDKIDQALKSIKLPLVISETEVSTLDDSTVWIWKNKLASQLTISAKRKVECFVTSSLASIVLIGGSSGGVEALNQMLEGIKLKEGVAVVVAQHIDSKGFGGLVRRIKSLVGSSKVNVMKAGDAIEGGKLTIIPPQHNVAFETGGLIQLEKSDFSATRFTPNIDDLCQSFAKRYIGKLDIVILSGMGADGSLGVCLAKNSLRKVFVQKLNSCDVPGMPQEVLSVFRTAKEKTLPELKSYIESL